jgi:energy-converting hydrogenase Eha subunit G
MIRFLLRFLGLWILAAAFVLFIYDGTKSIAANAIYLTKVNDIWFSIHQKSLEDLKPAVEQYVGPWLWQSAFQPFFLNQPAWLVLGILAVLMILLGRKKKPLIGYARD